ncbi:hypothetical protein QBC37DRAFT_456034 [Rhypophila decipiens]|uniref:Serine protease n=1 Tax=Rhypophila decipiens TaxID=261697 RepID=A0AAN7B1C9_9PEZI|nr:hypothetical protein QBC37DRAFT_456034 [Rhypophila decipiens]
MSASKYAGVAGTWNLDVSRNLNAETFFSVDNTQEAIFDPDFRSPVDENDIKDGGKYRSIVKLQMRYEGQKPDDKGFAMGTGWLISPDTMVTAGHNVFDWAGAERGLGKAIHIKCYIGYHGRDNLNSPIVQSRLAKTVVAPAEWLASRENRHRDVAFIKVDRPFEGNLRTLVYKPTPQSGNDMLGVVGYPADKFLTSELDGREERGAIMYEQFSEVAYNLLAPENVLKYRISTFGGQSGSPVIRKGSKLSVAIGTHVYGGGDKNQASTIGSLGNDYESLLRVFRGDLPVVGQEWGIQLVRHLGSTMPIPPAQPVGAVQPGAVATGTVAEGFFTDLLKITKSVTPFMGPLGAAAGTAIGSVLHVVGESSWDQNGSSVMDPASVSASAQSKRISDRAILAESTLQAVLRMEQGPELSKILGIMSSVYSTDMLEQLVPQLKPVLVSAAGQLSANRDNVNRILQSPPQQIRQESIWDSIGSIIKDGVKFGTPLLSPMSKGAVEKLLKTGRFLTQESIFDDVFGAVGTAVKIGTMIFAESAPSSGGSPSAEGWLDDTAATLLLAKRALMGEAALQAVSRLSDAELSSLPKMPREGPNGQMQAEGFFDFVKDMTSKIGNTIANDVAPFVMNKVIPGTFKVLNGPMQESSGFLGVLGGSSGGLRRKPSLLDMIHNGTLGNGISQLAVSGQSGEQQHGDDDTISSQVQGLHREHGPAARRTERIPSSLEELRLRYLEEGPDSNLDGLCFQEL